MTYHITAIHTVFSKTNIIPVKNLYDYKLTLAFKREVFDNRTFLRDLSSLKENISIHITRHKEKWNVITPRANYSTEKLSFTLPTLLNNYNKTTTDILKVTNAAIRQHYV